MGIEALLIIRDPLGFNMRGFEYPCITDAGNGAATPQFKDILPEFPLSQAALY